MEGYEQLIQDPYKLNDEVRGRREEFAALLADGTPLSCKAPERCSRCYLERLCGTLDETIAKVKDHSFSIYRARAGSPEPPFPTEIAWVEARDVAEAVARAARLPGEKLILDCADYDGLDAAAFAPKRIARAEARSARAIDQLLAVGDFEIAVHLDGETAAHLVARGVADPRFVLTLRNHERVTDARAAALDLPAFFAAFDRLPGAGACAVENVPACLSGRAPRPRPRPLDGETLDGGGALDVFGYTRRYILDGYYTKSRRCRACVHDGACEGVHINFVRAHGYAPLVPVEKPS